MSAYVTARATEPPKVTLLAADPAQNPHNLTVKRLTAGLEAAPSARKTK